MKRLFIEQPGYTGSVKYRKVVELVIGGSVINGVTLSSVAGDDLQTP